MRKRVHVCKSKMSLKTILWKRFHKNQYNEFQMVVKQSL